MNSRTKKLLSLVLGNSGSKKNGDNKLSSGVDESRSDGQINQAMEVEFENELDKCNPDLLNEAEKCFTEEICQILEDKDNCNPDLLNEADKGFTEEICQILEDKDNCNPELLNEAEKGFTEEICQILEDKDGDSISSELNESRQLIAKQMEQIIGNLFSDSDNSIAESVEPSPQRHRPPIRVSDSASENSLFGGDFSDDDPTFHPPESPLRDSTSDTDSDDNLITQRDLLGSGKKNGAGMPSLEPQPGPSRQPEDNENIDTVNVSDFVSIIMADILDLVWSRVKPLTRWRTANPDSWKKNVAKKRRKDGLPYMTNTKVRPAKIPKLVDCSRCTFKCTDALTLQQREKLCRLYWNLDFVGKKNFILSHVKVQPPKRVLVDRKRPRPYNTKCHLGVGVEQKQVCQKFFCATLNISASVIKDAIKNRDSDGLYLNDKDPRGPREAPNKTSEARVKEVIDHISSFPTMESHYIRKQSKRKYLDCRLTISKMYALYKENHKENPVSEMTHRRIFSKEFNLSFFVPKKDQCLTCNKYYAAEGQKKIDQETIYSEHIEREIVCTNEKEEDKKRAEMDQKFISITFDLQAIHQIPCSMIWILFFVRKLTLYNLCIYESALPNNAYCFPWSEVHGKKGSAEIGTILLHYLTKCVPSNVTEVSMFSDTCSGQNRNQYVTAILLWAVNTIENIQIIEQKFLESGHSYMEADSMHSSIENAKKHADVFSITDWINIFKRARSKAFYFHGNDKVIKPPYQVKELKYRDFFDLKALAETMIKNKTKDNNGNKVNWLKIKRLKYMKDDRNIYFNYDMSTNYLSFDTRPEQIGPRTRKGNRKSNPNSVEPTTVEEFVVPTLKQLYSNPLPISAAKKRDLISLCDKGIIPEEYHGWFKSLTCENDILDRAPDVAAADTSSDEE